MKIRILAALFIFLNGCAYVYTARGVYYRVQTGDTLASIAGKYHRDLQDLAEVNNIESDEGLKVGRSIFIPGVTPSTLAGIIEPARKGTRKPLRRQASLVPQPRQPAIEVDHGRFSWPIEGPLSSLFGVRRGRRHDGIDIRAKRGTPVHAAAEGEVVYSKRMRGYGNLILLRHDDDFFTVYAHNSVNLAKKGKKVQKGEVISKVGQTGRATGPHLHFEVREGSKARNPLFFLPKKGVTEKEEGGTSHGGSEE